MSITPPRPWRYLLAAFALGPLFALGLTLEVVAFAWLRFEAPFLGTRVCARPSPGSSWRGTR